jgi:predicted GNAT family acetyltransferase
MNVQHDAEHHRFFVTLPEGHGELVYRVVAPHVLDLQHTGVDVALRGHGVAEALAQAALDVARSQGDRVIPSCPFVRSWIARHPAYQDLVAPP